MGCVPVDVGAVDDAARIDAVVVEMHGLRHAGPLKKLAGVGSEVGVTHDSAPVAFEMPVIDQIKADKGGEQAPAGLCDPVAIR